MVAGYTHELVHIQIYDIYGIDSKMIFKDFSFATRPESNCPTENCIFQHNINEAVGYNLFPIFLVLWGGFYLLIKKDENEI